MANLVEIAGSDSSCSDFCSSSRISLFSGEFFNINCLFLTARHLFEDLISLDQQLSKTHATQLFRVHSIQGGRQIRGRFLRNITFVLWRDKRQYGRLCSLSMQTFIKHTDLLCGWTIVSPDISCWKR